MIRFAVNGSAVEVEAEPRLTLADCLRQKLRLSLDPRCLHFFDRESGAAIR